jgi:hypothetical protein
MPEEFWEQHRSEALSPKDTTTYHVVDSLGKVLKLDRRLSTFETFVTGYIPFRFLHIDYTSILNYNEFEGIRVRFGAITNNKISRYVTLGGYFAYGFRDKETKCGGKVSVKMKQKPEIVWINNIGFTDRKLSDSHSNLNRKTMGKGYFESGILVNNLVNQWFLGIGRGTFYRYGPYSLTKTIDNFAFKLTVTLNI